MAMLCPFLAAHSADLLVGRVGSIGGDDWKVEDLEVAVDLGNEALAAGIRVGLIEVIGPELSLADSRIQCGRVEVTPEDFACRDATFDVELPGVGRQSFPGQVGYNRSTGALRFELTRVPVAGGTLRLQGAVSQETVDIQYSGSALNVAALAGIAGRLGVTLEGYSASGTGDIAGTLRTRGGALSRMTARAALREVSMANESGTIVAESARGNIALELARSAGGWEFTIDVAADRGEAYVEPVYANLAETPVELSATGRSGDDFREVDLARYSVQLGAEFTAGGALGIRLPEGEAPVSLSGSVTLTDASFETMYTSLLQVFAAGTLFGNLETAGTVSGTISVANNAVASADLELRDIIADDRDKRFAVYGLDGRIQWPGADGEPGDSEASYLHWEGARVYEIPLGEARVDALLGGDDFELQRAVRVPTLDGFLDVNRLSVRNYGKEDATGLLDAELEPVQLGELTSAFGWPAFSGTLAGKLPLLQYDGGTVTLGGTLSARAFDGDIEFSNLRLEQPFGRVPRLYGDLRLRELNLEQVTDTFSFGLIQGRLSGDVTGLEMTAWVPTAMDLHLYTPPDDRSRRRISQRAVENLASVGGGGAAAALSGGFMSFFDVFSYRRIGLRCVLADGTCRMSGAGPAGDSEFGQGYYIVEGSGLPRIDVVGYRSEVSWSRLVRQLAQIMESGAPTVN
jgi:hypothetical protein